MIFLLPLLFGMPTTILDIRRTLGQDGRVRVQSSSASDANQPYSAQPNTCHVRSSYKKTIGKIIYEWNKDTCWIILIWHAKKVRWPRDARVDYKWSDWSGMKWGLAAGSLAKVGISSCHLKGESGCDLVAQDIPAWLLTFQVYILLKQTHGSWIGI